MKTMTAAALLFAAAFPASFASENGDQEMTFRRRREKMVKEQIKARGVDDPRVINAMLKVKRHLFVPEAVKGAAYSDRPLPIGYGQTISQPFIVGYMTQALDLDPADRVLEIGTGSGYQAAVLAELAGEVYSVEIIGELAEQARRTLERRGYDNVKVKYGDGYEGWKEHAPYDAVIVTAAPPQIPEELIRQLRTGGRMIVPAGRFYQELVFITKKAGGRVERKKLMPVRFVPMVRSGGR
ncbi:MAG: protein-L-isoaspartate(D-aspartate) O-methyltransferase [Candidatus Omnitrophica bacterium]|nr:protein-L-isoaspartate(D-aspartate) O-methyltransferase [Candidatus Omnitrophota bacterium]